MLVISPRSYVTAAFDLLFPELAEEVEKWLKRLRPDDWWQYYIYEPREEIFQKDELFKREQYYGKPFPNNGCLEDLIEHFDEHYLDRLVNHSPQRPERERYSREREMADLISDLSKIRNDWAHRGRRVLKRTT